MSGAGLPAEAVEAAAKALLQSLRPTKADWNLWTEDGRETWREYSRAALEAAGPHLLAQGWDECAKSPSRPDLSANPYRQSRNAD